MKISLGVLKLTHDGREKLAVAFTVISFILAVLSAILIITGIYVINIVAANLDSEKAVIRLIFTVIGMLATQLVIYYIAGIFVGRKCHKFAYKKNSRYLLRLWTFSGYSSILNIVVIGSMAAGVSNHIVRSMHHSMIRGMKRYLKDPNWKRIIDSLQYKMQCCGSKQYTDWHQISWISTWHIINNEGGIQKNFNLNGDRLYVPAVPWSCCRLDYPKQCFHDPIQQYQYFRNWDTLSEESVYNIGCVEILRQPIENSFLYFILITYFILLLQIVLTVLSRYLYTSYRNAVVLGDPYGVSPGWIVAGKTASEIMAESRLSLSSTSGNRTISTCLSSSRSRSKSSDSSGSRSCSCKSSKSSCGEDSDDE